MVLVCHLFGDNAKCRYSLCIGYSSGLYAVGGFVDQGRVEGAISFRRGGRLFSDLGLFQANTNVNNELISLQSPAIMLDVVNRLRLDVAYHTDGAFYRKVLYGQDLPVSVSFADLQDNESVSFTLRLLDEENVELSDFIREGEELEETSVMTCKLRELVTTPVGKLTIDPTPYFKERSLSRFMSRDPVCMARYPPIPVI